MYNVDKTQLAWCAGFFDGEGYVGIDKYGRLHLSMTQKYPELLDRFDTLTGKAGGIYYDKNGYYKYHVTTFEKCQAAIVLMWKWLGPYKKEQYKVTISKYKDYIKCNPGLQNGFICRKGHNIRVTGIRFYYRFGERMRMCGECRRISFRKWYAKNVGVIKK